MATTASKEQYAAWLRNWKCGECGPSYPIILDGFVVCGKCKRLPPAPTPQPVDDKKGRER